LAIDPVHDYLNRRLQRAKIERARLTLYETIHDHLRQEGIQGPQAATISA